MTKIDWSKWSAIAEILSAVAILITLVYLAVQTRYSALQTQQNTAALHSNSRQEILNAEVDLLYELMERPFVIEQWRSETDSLTPNQRIQADLAGTAYFRMRENLWLQYRNDVIDDETWQTYRGILVGNLADSEVLRELWNRIGERGFVEGFYEEITEDLSSGTAGGTLLDNASADD